MENNELINKTKENDKCCPAQKKKPALTSVILSAVAIIVLVLLFSLFNNAHKQTKTESSTGGIFAVDTNDEINIEITEDLDYAACMMEIYYHYEKYEGMTITLTGMQKCLVDKNGTKGYNYIGRKTTDTDENGEPYFCGIQYTYEGDMPKDGEWIKVTGIVDWFETDTGLTSVVIRAASREPVEAGTEYIELTPATQEGMETNADK